MGSRRYRSLAGTILVGTSVIRPSSITTRASTPAALAARRARAMSRWSKRGSVARLRLHVLEQAGKVHPGERIMKGPGRPQG